ncbi:MAG TPA: hypothetical protein VKS81_07565, partial [Bacteroidota bacterium]|nr:hypothetical protein [Bacteroidota bacterium]
TASLFIVGLIVVAIGMKIPDRIATAMEFCVALMLIGLGANVLRKLFMGGTFHTHTHDHGGHLHVHPHIHEQAEQPAAEAGHHESSAIRSFFKGKRSIFIGMVHGMAGSAALMLIVLATIPSPTLALVYIAVFGIGSVGGMFIMSALIGIPFVMTAHKSEQLNYMVRLLSGTVSVVFGLIYAWQVFQDFRF